MKKVFAFILVIICFGILVGCSEKEASDKEELMVYSFSGKNDQIAVSNGVIVLNSDEEVFYGGDLEVLNEELCTDIASYSTTFYTVTNGEQRTILSNSVTDMTSGSIHIAGDLGRMSGADLIIENKVENAEDLRYSLYFELSVTDMKGEQGVYRIQMEVTEVTD